MTGPDWSVTATTDTAEGTRVLAAALAPLARPGDVVLLVGGMGAGKTTFAQGFARGLGVAGPVTSPTFTLVRQYPCVGAVRQLLHADVYRLDTLAEVADLGLSELVEPGLLHEGAVALVEWGDAAAPALGDDTLTVALEPSGHDDARMVTVSGRGAGWADRRAAVTAALVTNGSAGR
jgi:tRNA threonylcarbamoyladenosine biosynthesis protein TsaE